MTDAKISARYRELASEEPSALIDDAIRAAARRAVAARRSSFEKRWAAPVSIAAVLVLAVGVTLRMQLEKPGVEVPSVDPGAPPASQLEPVAPAAAPSAAPPASTPAPAEADAVARRAAPGVAAPPMKESFAPERKLEAQEDRRQKKDQARADVNTATQVAGATAQAPPPPAARAPAAPAPLPKAEQKPEPVPFPAAPATADAYRARQESSGHVAPQPLAKAKEAEVSTGEKAIADKVAANVAAPGRPAAATIASSTPSEAAAPAAPAAAGAPSAAKLAAGASRDSLSSAGERAASPEKELERIAELRRAGRDTEADEAIARFKRDHPDYRIAEEIWEKVRPR